LYYTHYSISGQAAQNGVVQRDNSKISVSKLATGIYILKAVGQESGKVLPAKLPF